MHLDSFMRAKEILVRLKKDTQGQDLIEYALLTGFMVIAAWALFPVGIVPSISHIFSKLLNTASVLVP